MFGTQEGLLCHFQWSKLLGLDMHTQCLAATLVIEKFSKPKKYFCSNQLRMF